MLLVFIIVFSTSFTAFALDKESKDARISLNITSDPEEILIIQETMGNSNLLLSQQDNNIIMNFSNVYESGEKVVVSGTLSAKMFGNIYNSTFSEEQLKISTINGTKLYAGVFEVGIDDNTLKALVDITTTNDFSKAVVSYTIIDETTDSYQLMLYGDKFDEQVEIYKQNLISSQRENFRSLKEIMVDNSSTIMPFAVAKDSSPYEHVNNTYSKRVNGETTEKEMIVMNVSKCDPKDLGSGQNGYEMIRVFSRSYNIPKANARVLLAKPLRMKVTFDGDEGLMGVNNTKPNKTNGTLQSVFDIFNSVTGAVGGTKLVTVSAIISSLSIGIGDTITKSGSSAKFDVVVSDKISSDKDIPASTTYNKAHLNSKNGVTFKVSYEGDPDYKKANIDVTAVITYQVFLNTDRTASWKSGTAKISHTVNLN